MATTAPRIPFAPVNESRLQSLTSLKNRQNALPPTLTTSTKRKASTYESDLCPSPTSHSHSDHENIDPVHFFSKKSKTLSSNTFTKPTNYILKPTQQTPASAPRPRITSTTTKISTSIVGGTPLSAPAGRSPTRKRAGILSSRRKTSIGNGSPYTRIDPPRFSTTSNGTSGLGFSIASALSSTVPSSSSTSLHRKSASQNGLLGKSKTARWEFTIYEDTPQEEATNLMEHGACILDISDDSDSSFSNDLRRERGKENVPPVDDVSQTRLAASSSGVSAGVGSEKSRMRKQKELEAGDIDIDIDRSPLSSLLAKDFYAPGCDGSEIVIVPGDEDGEQGACNGGALETATPDIPAPEQQANDVAFTFSPALTLPQGQGTNISTERIEALMQKDDISMPTKARLLEPIEKAEEGFEVWESGSAKGDEE